MHVYVYLQLADLIEKLGRVVFCNMIYMYNSGRLDNRPFKNWMDTLQQSMDNPSAPQLTVVILLHIIMAVFHYRQI